jgi:hypothetical protein
MDEHNVRVHATWNAMEKYDAASSFFPWIWEAK